MSSSSSADGLFSATSSADEAEARYTAAIAALNQLQSSPSSRASRQSPAAPNRDRSQEMAQLAELAAAVGLDQASLSGLRVVHIAGTKGKGSTAAYTERLLRQGCGLRTGFFSSPHLVEVRERIRLDGRPISQSEFAELFWRLHADLTQAVARSQEAEFPRYFRFLTFMAMRLFVERQVDVAIIEVGIGGRYDSTNFVGEPWVCGIASLGHDHTALLGSTLEQIAWHKAGIMKPSCIAVAAPGQPAECLPVLERVAAEVGCPFRVAPRLSDLSGFEQLGLDGYQQVNAALALQLARLWLRRYRDFGGDVSRFDASIRDVIESVAEEDLTLNGSYTKPGSSFGDVMDGKLLNSDVREVQRLNYDVIDSPRLNSDVIQPVATNGDVIDWSSSSESHPKQQKVAQEANAELSGFSLPDGFIGAIRATRWPGRNTVLVQKVATANENTDCVITYYIDGAHTIESCPLAGAWFAKSTSASPADQRFLIFNRTGDRNPLELIDSLLRSCRSSSFFSAGLFCPNVVDSDLSAHPELANLMVSPGSAQAAVEENAQAFADLTPTSSGVETIQLSCVRDAVDWVRRRAVCKKLRSVDVLVTGSLHLVGCLLAVLRPDIADQYD